METKTPTKKIPRAKRFYIYVVGGMDAGFVGSSATREAAEARAKMFLKLCGGVRGATGTEIVDSEAK